MFVCRPKGSKFDNDRSDCYEARKVLPRWTVLCAVLYVHFPNRILVLEITASIDIFFFSFSPWDGSKYTHKTIGDHIFLGGFSYENKYYDLYHSTNPMDETEWVEARYGNDIRCYIGSELLFAGFDESAVIQEAARRWNNRLVAN